MSTSARSHLEILTEIKVMTTEINNIISFFLEIRLKLIQKCFGTLFNTLIWMQKLSIQKT